MNKKALDEKYSYQIDEHHVVHLFRRGEDWQEHLTNPLISAIFKIETLEKENAELKLRLEALERQTPWKDIKDKSELIGQLTKAKEIIKNLIAIYYDPVVLENDIKLHNKIITEAKQFLKEE